ncbi:MAG: hypothetical protein H7263_14830 [Candidatus Sericytochromatia bacterium]|nr:hypothetical protein [Candidatus Sericytochromatia bacterium]
MFSNSSENNQNNKENLLKSVEETFDNYTSEEYNDEIDANKKKQAKNSEIPTFNSLKQGLQDTLKKAQGIFSKDKIDHLAFPNKARNKEIIDKSSNLSQEDKDIIIEKVSKWESTEEVNVVNASAVLLWSKKFSKSKIG